MPVISPQPQSERSRRSASHSIRVLLSAVALIGAVPGNLEAGNPLGTVQASPAAAAGRTIPTVEAPTQARLRAAAAVKAALQLLGGVGKIKGLYRVGDAAPVGAPALHDQQLERWLIALRATTSSQRSLHDVLRKHTDE